MTSEMSHTLDGLLDEAEGMKLRLEESASLLEALIKDMRSLKQQLHTGEQSVLQSGKPGQTERNGVWYDSRLHTAFSERNSRMSKECMLLDQNVGELSSVIEEHISKAHEPKAQPIPQRWPLSDEEYKRYGRQLIMPEIGLKGQLKLKAASVLIVGLGGLGCPAAAYLAGAGVGKIGLLDGDTVELSNLHRQIAHTAGRVGRSKAQSAFEHLYSLNPLAARRYKVYDQYLTPENALDVFADYDVILDCTDRPTSRYLISDAAVLLQKPLVSASALRIDGQLMVLNDPPAPAGNMKGGPCYRCIFPKPPPAETVVSCGDGGILGPVVGVMGVLQALETLKIVVSRREDATSNGEHLESQAGAAPSPSLLIFSAFSPQPFRSVKLRPRRKACVSCSAEASITVESLTSGSLDYVQFCGVTKPVTLLSRSERISAKELGQILESPSSHHLIIDTREEVQFEICNLGASINVPFSQLVSHGSEKAVQSLAHVRDATDPIYCICRLGNDSQVAVRKLQEMGFDPTGTRRIVDIVGGLKAWKEEVDPTWPEY